jgi:uncharacterized membrane protein YfcA
MILAFACLAVAMGAAAQAISGIGFALVCVPLLVALVGPKEGVRLAILLSAFVNIAVLSRVWRYVRWREISLFLVTALPVTPIVALAIRHAKPTAVQVVAGVAVLVGVSLLATGRRLEVAATRPGALVAGAASAAMNTAAATGGPAMAIWMTNARWPPLEMRATLQAFFLPLNAAGLISLGVGGITFGKVGVMTVALVAGSFVGARFASRIPARAASFATLAIAAAGGMAAVVSALVA